MDIDVSVTQEADDRLLLKMQTHTWEINVWGFAHEFARLRDIRTADYGERRSIAAGESAGESAFWACEAGQVTLMIGHDDETWDIAVTVPVEVVDAVVRQVGQEA